MTTAQSAAVAELLARLAPVEGHHGDCCGADKQFHQLCRSLLPEAKIVVHPPFDAKKRAFCEGDVTLEPKDYLVRNHGIVDAVETMIATPREDAEVKRSGTWATVRYARKTGRTVYLVLPDGTLTD